jgi:flagellar biosynthetic protein FliP
MAPVWTETYEQGIKPYTNQQLSLGEAFSRGVAPVRRFMAHQIQRCKNDEDVYLFLRYLPDEGDAKSTPNYVYYNPQESEREVPLVALLPAFMLSEMKTAFLIGFQIYLPFVILDIVVASVTISWAYDLPQSDSTVQTTPIRVVDGWHLVMKCSKATTLA